jgi:pyruvate,water dikinase
VHGTPVSPGVASGKVRVVLDADGFGSFLPGEVLVAPLTAPAWNELFERAAAVVTDGGNLFSHASIAAREYGIPAVAGCIDATRRLRDGEQVTVDGSKGTVTASS